MTRRLPPTVAAAVLAWIVAPAPRADAEVRADWPCPSCLLSTPSGYSPGVPAPLLVALHGDEGTSAHIFSALRRHTESAGMILVSLQCPSSEGCAGSWWRWLGTSSHDPGWVDRQVDAVEAEYSVDPTRVYLAGWSGGATYLGWLAPERSERFAAVAYFAGGARSGRSSCASCRIPAYFLIGDGDFLLGYAEGLRDSLEACGHEVVWDLRPGVDHWAMSSLVAGADGAEVLDWMEANPHPCLAGAPPTDAGAGPPAQPDGGSGSIGGDGASESRTRARSRTRAWRRTRPSCSPGRVAGERGGSPARTRCPVGARRPASPREPPSGCSCRSPCWRCGGRGPGADGRAPAPHLPQSVDHVHDDALGALGCRSERAHVRRERLGRGGRWEPLGATGGGEKEHPNREPSLPRHALARRGTCGDDGPCRAFAASRPSRSAPTRIARSRRHRPPGRTSSKGCS